MNNHLRGMTPNVETNRWLIKSFETSITECYKSCKAYKGIAEEFIRGPSLLNTDLTCC